jgi:hypothetical protein
MTSGEVGDAPSGVDGRLKHLETFPDVDQASEMRKMPIHNDVERENEELRRRVAELEAKKDGGLIRSLLQSDPA